MDEVVLDKYGGGAANELVELTPEGTIDEPTAKTELDDKLKLKEG